MNRDELKGYIEEAADRTNTLRIMLEELLLSHPAIRGTHSTQEYEAVEKGLQVLYEKLCYCCQDMPNIKIPNPEGDWVVSVDDAIACMKAHAESRGRSYLRDNDALTDFKALHWGVETDEPVNRVFRDGHLISVIDQFALPTMGGKRDVSGSKPQRKGTRGGYCNECRHALGYVRNEDAALDGIKRVCERCKQEKLVLPARHWRRADKESRDEKRESEA